MMDRMQSRSCQVVQSSKRGGLAEGRRQLVSPFCSACKARRVRCDLQRPICSNCKVLRYKRVYTRSAPLSYRETSFTTGWDIRAPINMHIPGLIPGTAHDPFDVLPIQLGHQDRELWYHFTLHRMLVRTAFPKHPYPSDMGLDNVNIVWARTTIIMAIGHQSLIRGVRDTFQGTYLHHNLEIIRGITEHVEAPIDLSNLVASEVTGLIFADLETGHHKQAEAHLHGLLSILDRNERLQGPRPHIGLIRRLTVVVVGTIFASLLVDSEDGPAPEVRSLTPSGQSPRRFWADVAYLVAHMIIEFQRDALYASMTGAEGCVRCDSELLRWLYVTISRNRASSSPGGSDSGIGSSASPSANLRTIGKRASDDIWKWKTIVGFYALIVSTLGQANWSLSSGETTTPVEDWLDAWIRTWRSSGRTLVSWPWLHILRKVAWLDTDEGLHFVQNIWQGAVKGSSV